MLISLNARTQPLRKPKEGNSCLGNAMEFSRVPRTSMLAQAIACVVQ